MATMLKACVFTKQREIRIQIDDIQKRLTSREVDLNRVRGQREEARAELGQLKMQESEKLKQVEQIRVLASSRQVRYIASLLTMDRA
jgi:vacuolar-type H+-ATPase subunit I/STV1